MVQTYPIIKHTIVYKLDSWRWKPKGSSRSHYLRWWPAQPPSPHLHGPKEGLGVFMILCSNTCSSYFWSQRFSLNITFSVMIITTPLPVGQEMGWVRCQRSTLTPSYNFLSSPFQLRHLQFNVVILIIISFALYPFLTPLFPLEHHFFDHCLGIQLQVTLPFCLAQNIIREAVEKIGILSKNIISICCSS